MCIQGNRESKSCVPQSRTNISSVTRCLLHVYHVPSELSNPNIICVPRLLKKRISCIERYGHTKCPTIGSFLHSSIVLYFVNNYMHTYRIFNDIDNTVGISYYSLHLSPIKKCFWGEGRHNMFLISPI